jgi:hypothetical protein
MMRTLVATLVATCLAGGVAHGQSLTTEISTAGGVSTDRVAAIATQLRTFGELPTAIRYYIEGAWGAGAGAASDAFGAAYPYHNRIQIVEAYGERFFRPGGGIVGLRAGRFRTPFGISAASDHAYTGFVRAPLVRYDGYFALSNNFLEHGADLVVGAPWLTLEATAGVPADVGELSRPAGLDSVFRVQSYRGPFIAGASHLRTLPYQRGRFISGRTEFTGIDLRWMRNGIQLRGEWLTGHPFRGTRTHGWYADAIVHHLAMGPVTAVARIEQLDYVARPPFDKHARRQTFGARVRLPRGLAVQMNLLHHSGLDNGQGPMALDLGLNYSIRAGR